MINQLQLASESGEEFTDIRTRLVCACELVMNAILTALQVFDLFHFNWPVLKTNSSFVTAVYVYVFRNCHWICTV